ncbi:integrase [Gracilaria domingensis]|nr:integrase [Gracilaria domingensis]
MSNLICAIHLVAPATKKKLYLSSRALEGWDNARRSQSSVPITKQFAFVIAGWLIANKEFSVAVALLVAWSGYLRASEVLPLSRSLIALPGDPRIWTYKDGTAGVCIKDTKTGPFQFVPICKSEAVTALKVLKTNSGYPLSDEIKVFNLSYATYSKKISLACKKLGMHQFRITTHSARIGGALHDYIIGMSAETFSITGRWKSLSSLRHYLTNGRAWKMKLKVTTETEA